MAFSLVGATDRYQRVAMVLSDLFWRFMTSEPSVEPKYMSPDSAAKLLLGCIMNRGVTAERAAAAPDELARRINADGDLVWRILEIGEEGVYAAMTEKPMLHRFPAQMAKNAYLMAQVVTSDYQGNAANIWSSTPEHPLDSKELYKRLTGLRGLGLKTGTLTMRILVLGHDIRLTDGLDGLDASPDVHVVRVFVRLGLVSKGAKPIEVVEAARQLANQTGHPAVVMDGAWMLGADRVCENTDGSPESEKRQRQRCKDDCPLCADCLFPAWTVPEEVQRELERL